MLHRPIIYKSQYFAALFGIEIPDVSFTAWQVHELGELLVKVFTMKHPRFPQWIESLVRGHSKLASFTVRRRRSVTGPSHNRASFAGALVSRAELRLAGHQFAAVC